MSEIILSAEQMRILGSADGLVAIRRPDGSVLGWVSPKTNFIIPEKCPFTAAELEEAEAAAKEAGPYYTTQEIMADLRAHDGALSGSRR
jgi:hypothetical protein